MAMRLICLSVLGALMLACGSAQTTAKARAEAMARIRPGLERIRVAEAQQPPKPFDVPFSGSTSSLVGASQAEIRAGLGPPTRTDCDSSSSVCVWQYSLYYLPANYTGGGQELVIHFDRGVVSEVTKLMTQ